MKDHKTTIIAEIGINHQGDMNLALEMAKKSADCGADVVKFQWYDPVKVLGLNSPYFAEAKKAQFNLPQHKELKAYCEGIGTEWMCSIFHLWQVSVMEYLEVKRYKIASRAAKDFDLVKEIGRTRKPVIMSTGLSGDDEIKRALSLLPNSDVTLLYCVCDYPTKADIIDLSKMTRFGKTPFSRTFGFSSHCPDSRPSVAAAALGASVLENHVVLDKSQAGCDVPSSLDFAEFSKLVDAVKVTEATAC